MKKIIAVLSAVIILTVTAFAGLTMAEEADLTGEWNLQSMNQGGMEMNASLLSLLGMDMVLVLNEDGTATMTMMGGEEGVGTWTESTITINEDEVPYRLEDGLLVMEKDDEKMVFGREGGSNSSLAPAVTVTDPAEFDGTWTAETYVAMGIALPLQDIGVQISLTIADGKAAVSEAVLDLENEGEVSDSMEAEFDAVLQEDGTLYIDFAGQDILGQLELEAAGINLTLHEDGRLSGTLPAPAAEEAAETDAAEGESEGESEGDSGTDSDGGSSGEESAEPAMYLILVKAES